jgi:ATP-dependent DNA helicase RecG
MMKAIIDTCCSAMPDILPDHIIKKYSLLPAAEAIAEVHFPEQEKDIMVLNRGESAAHRRMSFEELFTLELGLALRKRGMAAAKKGIAFKQINKLESALRAKLPYQLTNAQERVIAEIKKDMTGDRPMNRLVQGDVGCGKTIVALIAALAGEQLPGLSHGATDPAHNIQKHRGAGDALASPYAITGGLRKRQNVAETGSGAAGIVVGTHALIEQNVRFKRLGLAIIDEQHRFGVMQRSTLTSKGYEPDVLVMTATPIPRTLALTVYGDLDVSVINEMPPGRSPIVTRIYFESRRRDAYQFLEEELKKGRQVYVVYPLVEETEKSDLKATTEMAAHIQKDIFPNWKVGRCTEG